MGPKKRAGKSKPKPNRNSDVGDSGKNSEPVPNPNSEVGDSSRNLEPKRNPNSDVGDRSRNLEPMRNPNSDVGDSSMNLESMPNTSSDLSLRNFEPTPNPEKKSDLGECSSNLENESDEVLSVIKHGLDCVFDVEKLVVSAYLRAFLLAHLEENEDINCELIEGLKDEKSSILFTIQEKRKEYMMTLEHFNGRCIYFEEKSKNLLKVIQPIELLLDNSEKDNGALKEKYNGLRFDLGCYEQKATNIWFKLGRKMDDQDIELLTRVTYSSDEALKFLFQAAKSLGLTSGYKQELKIRAQVIRGHLQRVASEVEKMVTSLTDQKCRNQQLEMSLKDALAISSKTLRSFKKCCLALGCTVNDFGFHGEGKLVELQQQIVLHLDAIETSFKNKDQIIQEMRSRIEISQAEQLRKNSFLTIVAVAATTLAAAFLSTLSKGPSA